MKTIFFYFLMIVQITAQSEYKNLLISNAENFDKTVIIGNKEEVKKDHVSLELRIPLLGNVSIVNPTRKLKEITKKLALKQRSMAINSDESISFTENKEAVINK